MATAALVMLSYSLVLRVGLLALMGMLNSQLAADCWLVGVTVFNLVFVQGAEGALW